MSDRVGELEAKVEELSASLRKMESRVSLLERSLTPAAARRVRAAAAVAETQTAATAAMLRQDAAHAGGTVSLVGRTLLVLAGAYALRALTDKQLISTWIGATMGFLYAGVWVALADRDAGRQRFVSASFHGGSAVMIGFPLLTEATARFHLFPTWFAVVLLSGFTAGALLVAARQRFQTLAWLVVLAAIPAAFALMVAQGRVAAPLVFLVVLGFGTVWLGYLLDWHALRWPPALAADLAVLFLAVEAVRPGAPDGPVTAVIVQFVLMATYLGSTAVRTLRLRRNVVGFETVQGALVVASALGGAAFISSQLGAGSTALGVLALGCGAVAYGVAHVMAERDRSAPNFAFYVSLGLAFVLAGATFLLAPMPRALFWSVFAVGAAWASGRPGRGALCWQAAIFALAAGLAGGTLAHASETLFSTPSEPWTPAGLGALAVAAALALVAWALSRVAPRGTLERVPRVVTFVAAAVTAAGLVAGWVAPAVAGVPGAGADAGTIATVRTVVLSVGALALALLGRVEAIPEAGWLVWPVLGVTGLKMLVEDMPRSRPATLFLAFAIYGASLILVPRLRRREAAPARSVGERPAA